MDCTIPYHHDLLLGKSVDLKCFKMGYMLVGDEVKPVIPMVRLSTSQFTFVRSLKDVCDILSIPPEYALKVKARKLVNETVSACLDAIGNWETSFAVIFRTSFLQQKQYLPSNAVTGRPSRRDESGRDESEINMSTSSQLAQAVADLDSVDLTRSRSIQEFGTHWVKAIEIGNELITIMRISCEDSEKLQKLESKIGQCLKSHHGLIDQQKMEALLGFAKDADKKLAKKSYKDVKLQINYCSFDELPRYSSSLTGMVKTIEKFLYQCIGWTESNRYDDDCQLESQSMSVKPGLDVDEKSFTDNLKSAWQSLTGPSSKAPKAEYHSPKSQEEDYENVDNEEGHDSFVVLGSQELQHFYYLRATLQSFDGEIDYSDTSSLSSLALSQYPERTYNMFERLYKLVCYCDEAADLLQKFLSSRRFWDDVRVAEGNTVLKNVQTIHLAVHDAIHNLDLVSLPDESSLNDILNVNPLDIVNSYIETVTSKLPPGSDLDLLMIGKTGHGKSSTGNSILGQEKFHSSSDGNSVTTHTSVGWVEVDGRTIKVVDTPGVCDTNLEEEADSIDLAIKSISDAIANCPEGFHALLLIIRFGTRMTSEEKKAIGLLKCVLGEDVIKNNCVCVITHGDNFEKENTKPFQEWCRDQKNFLGDLFKECDYRCVLFNNKAETEKVKKRQLIELVAKADSLKGNGTRYTNAIFQFAQKERSKVIEEKRLPQVSEDMVRDIQMIIEYLNGMIGNTSQQYYKEELSRLKEKVDNLSNRVTEAETGQFGRLVDTVFALAATIHSKMDEIADRRAPDLPDDVTVVKTDSQEEPSTNDEETVVVNGEAGQSDNTFLDRFRGELQGYYDTEISPQNSIVNEIVSERVKEQVQKEHHCFPGDSVVYLSTGEWVTMNKLQVGDKVLTRYSNGQLGFDTVYMFGHQDFLASSDFIVIETASGKVHVSDKHYIYCDRNGQERCLAAKDVSIGDSMLLLHDDSFLKSPVLRVGYEMKQGLFAPFTNCGTMVVDKFLVSCYVNVLQPDSCHLLLWPVRQLYKLSPAALAYVNRSSSKQAIPSWAQVFTKLM